MSFARDLVVWKFRIAQPDGDGRVYVTLPTGAQPLSVALQGSQMVLWALVDPDEEVMTRHPLIVCNTGQPIPGLPDHARFLGTVNPNGIVWHVFDASWRNV